MRARRGVPVAMTSAEAAQLALQIDAPSAPVELVRRPIVGGWVESIRTYPGYYHGNRIVLGAPPTSVELASWMTRYERLFAWRRAAYPGVVTWHTSFDQLIEIAPPGATIERWIALTAPRSRAPDVRADVRLRAFDSAADWDWLIAVGEAESPELGGFTRWHARTHEQLVAAGRGTWFALEHRGERVACAGLFVADGIARFANVRTLEAHRRRGFGRALIEQLVQRVPSAVSHTVIVAERESAGEALYRSVGFEPIIEIRSLMFSVGRSAAR